MRVYKCDFCGKGFDDTTLEVDLPVSFYEGIADDINCDLSEGEEPRTDAGLAKKAGRVWLCVGTEGQCTSEFEYDACPECLVELIEAEAKRKLAEERNA